MRTAGEPTTQALAAARSDSPELAVVDLRMPGRSGLELVRELKALDPATRVVVLTGYGSIATAVDAMQLGADALPAQARRRRRDPRRLRRGRGRGAGVRRRRCRRPSLARAEWEHINRVLADCGGNISEAARRLGIHRRSLQRKLAKYPPGA